MKHRDYNWKFKIKEYALLKGDLVRTCYYGFMDYIYFFHYKKDEVIGLEEPYRGLKKINVIHLNLKKQWYDLIKSGEKKVEYRDLSEHWKKRLAKFTGNKCKDTYVIFKNGYAEEPPIMAFKVENITIGKGLRKWGAKKGKEYFRLQLGNELVITTNDTHIEWQ